MPRGGYQKPRNPAPVSGPGALSRRTDGGPIQGAKDMAAGGKYGERKELQELQTSAPMQGNPVPNVPRPKVTKLFDPTERPDEPVTAGASVGPGFTPAPKVPAGRYGITTKYLPEMQRLAKLEETPQTFKTFVKYVEAVNRMDELNVTGA